MDDPQRELKLWLAEKVSPHGVAKKLADATGLTSDKITRSKELDSPDPKRRRALRYEEIRAIAMFFRELPPGYEGMRQWLRDADALLSRAHSNIIPSYDPDNEDATSEDRGFNGEYWKPTIPGALPEVDAEAGAGLGAVGEVVNVQVGNSAISAHKVVAEWFIPDQFLLHQAGASTRQSIVMEVRGDSMQPGFLPGDRVIVDLSQREFTVDGVYVFSDGHGEPQIKRLQKVLFSEPVTVKIISDNVVYGVSEVELSRVHIIGRVRGHVGRM